MTEHPQVPFDAALIADIAARMELRTPNAKALTKLAERFDTAAGEPFEAVCDLATAVGKTYLAAAVIDYLGAAGVRNVLVVTPGRTIKNKTIANFTENHPKSVLNGMDIKPVLITAENFNTGATAAALHDTSQVKVFVFTVQSLVKPEDDTRRRVRKHQEWLGEDLYQFLRDADDLVIIADEHHVYSEDAESFSAAIRDLDPMALVGLTATPAKSDRDKVVYHYPLARAIADRYVKVPVLVGRKDDAVDEETRLRDGLLLLEAKQKAADNYARIHGKPRVNAVMFVVADRTDAADRVAGILRKPGVLDDPDRQVLTVHSKAKEESLSRLASVEDEDSPVKVIVSVSMLKEGWDVKNIFVICSLRPSISDVLTEQTLGRGLRLPWGEYTDEELLDTVEVLSHERYQQLLERSGILLKSLVEARVEPKPVVVPVDDGQGDTVVVVPSDPAPTTGDHSTATDVNGATTGPAANPDDTVARPTETETPLGQFLIAATESRQADAARQAEATSRPFPASRQITVPQVTRTVLSKAFTLSDVPEADFRELGRRLAAAGGTVLDRKLITVIEDASSPSGYKVVPREASDTIEAAPMLPLGGARQAIRQGLLMMDVVPESRASLNAADRLVDALIAGAGGEEALTSYLRAAVRGATALAMAAYRAMPESVDLTVGEMRFGPTRTTTRPIEANRFGPFSRKVAYTGWKRGLHSASWFDSSPERDFANIADNDATFWARIERGELVVMWQGGRYSPDFYMEFEGRHYLVEVKAQGEVEAAAVRGKKKAAETWARYVTDNGQYGQWRYVLIPDTAFQTAKTLRALLTLVGVD